MTCTRCGRRLKNASPSGMGPRCTLFVLGSKPKRQKRTEPVRDALTGELFPEARP